MDFVDIPSWDQYFMTMAYLTPSRSKDDSTRIGAVIVGPDNEIRSMGYNSFPRGIDDYRIERYQRPEKYFWMEHAERNAIYNASRIGVSTKGCRIYTQGTEGTPCTECCRGIIQSGITEVIVHAVPELEDDPVVLKRRQKWLEEAIRAKEMLKEAKVDLRIYSGPIISRVTGLYAGKTVEFD